MCGTGYVCEKKGILESYETLNVQIPCKGAPSNYTLKVERSCCSKLPNILVVFLGFYDE